MDINENAQNGKNEKKYAKSEYGAEDAADKDRADTDTKNENPLSCGEAHDEAFNEAPGETAEDEGSGDSSEHDGEKNAKTRDLKKQIKELKAQLAAAEKSARTAESQAAEAADKYMRIAAEYDNFRKRSIKEREGVYGEAYFDALMKMLPTIDNLERASQYTDAEKLAEGFKLILKSLPETLISMGIESFGEAGDEFDPSMHSAVMMVENADIEEGKIVSVLQRGYKRGERILRYAAVTVAGG